MALTRSQELTLRDLSIQITALRAFRYKLTFEAAGDARVYSLLDREIKRLTAEKRREAKQMEVK